MKPRISTSRARKLSRVSPFLLVMSRFRDLFEYFMQSPEKLLRRIRLLNKRNPAFGSTVSKFLVLGQSARCYDFYVWIHLLKYPDRRGAVQQWHHEIRYDDSYSVTMLCEEGDGFRSVP